MTEDDGDRLAAMLKPHLETAWREGAEAGRQSAVAALEAVCKAAEDAGGDHLLLEVVRAALDAVSSVPLDRSLT